MKRQLKVKRTQRDELGQRIEALAQERLEELTTGLYRQIQALESQVEELEMSVKVERTKNSRLLKQIEELSSYHGRGKGKKTKPWDENQIQKRTELIAATLRERRRR